MKSKDIVRCINKDALKAPFYGQLAEVKSVYMDDDIVTLEDFEGVGFDIKDFMVYRSYDLVQDIPGGLPLDLYEAFFVIQQWNQRNPDFMNIRIDSGDPREGGTLIQIGQGFDTHDPMEALKYILDYHAQLSDKRTLDLCAVVLEAQRKAVSRR
ncbi:hypothetical protein MQM1_024 [Aeromonas phage vB_AsaP_MQM1]|nr:hypothetical protein MQM1_024 [Aeromonas phage vB_AsaP_MQM1]